MKLLSIWQLLSDEQRTDVAKNLATHVPKMRTDTLKLLAYLHQNPDLTNETFDKNAAFAALYGNKTYNDNWLRLAQSQFAKGIERLIALRHLQNDTAKTTYALTDFYEKSAINPLFLKQQFQVLNDTNTTILQQNEQQYLRLLHTENLQLRSAKKQKKVTSNQLQTILELQEKYTAAAQLRTVCTALSQQRVSVFSSFEGLEGAADKGFFSMILQRIETQKWHETEPIIGAYYFIYKMMTEPENSDSEAFFQNFRSELPNYCPIFTKKEQQECYLAAINFAIQRVNQNKNEYLRILFELYQEGIESGILLMENGQISPVTFRNMVNIGLRVGETAYIGEFIGRLNTSLPKAMQRNYYEHALGRYLFATKDFENAKKMLLGLDYGDLGLQMDAKMILIKVYYETDDFDALEKHLSSFRQFLHRKRSSIGYHQINYKNIINLSKKLITLNLFDKKIAADLRQEIENTTPLTEREWLLAQL